MSAPVCSGPQATRRGRAVGSLWPSMSIHVYQRRRPTDLAVQQCDGAVAVYATCLVRRQPAQGSSGATARWVWIAARVMRHSRKGPAAPGPWCAPAGPSAAIVEAVGSCPPCIRRMVPCCLPCCGESYRTPGALSCRACTSGGKCAREAGNPCQGWQGRRGARGAGRKKTSAPGRGAGRLKKMRALLGSMMMSILFDLRV
jgi:hypothetical protein